MRQFKFILSFYFLPVYFFTLAISPNINGDRIGVVLVSVFLLLIPTANYIAANPGKRISPSEDSNYSFMDSLSLVMLIAAIYLGWTISWEFNLLQVLYLLVVVLISIQERNLSAGLIWLTSRALLGILLFASIYLGLNQYGFNNLLRTHIILFASLSILIIITSLIIANLHEYYLLHKDDIEDLPRSALKPIKMMLILMGLLFFAFAGFLIITYNWRYAGFFVLALMTSIIIAISMIRRVTTGNIANLPLTLSWLNIILSTCLVIFFIYFFLDSTQVLQAVSGGY